MILDFFMEKNPFAIFPHCVVGSRLMSKISEFPIYVLEIQFHFGNAKSFWMCLRKWKSVIFDIPKMQFNFQNINWEFRSLGHKAVGWC